MSDRLRPYAVPAALGFLILAATVVATRYGARIHLGQGDEFLNVLGARYVQHDPSVLFDPALFNRGPERLTALLLVVPDVVLGSSESQLKAGHFLLALAFCLVALPAAAFVRGLGGGPWAAVGAAAVCIVSPWLVFATSFLNVTLAVPSTALLLLASWWAAVRPGLRTDVLVLVAAGLAVFSRSGALPLLAVPAVVLLAQTIRVDRSPLALVRRHPLLCAVGAVFAVTVLLAGPRAFVGPAYAKAVGAVPAVDVIWDYTAVLFTQLTLGTGWLPMVIGLPWVLTQLVRPADDRTFAFAVTALSAFVVFVLVAAQAGAQTEERYIAVLMVLPPVAFVAAIARREVAVVPTLLAAVVTARAIATRSDSAGLLEFVAPARRFFDTVVAGRLSLALNTSPATARTITLVVLVVIGVAVAVGMRRRPAPVALVAFLGVLALGAAGSQHALSKWSLANASDIPWSQLTWIDRATGGDTVALWNENPDNDPSRAFEGEQIKFFNAGLRVAIDATLRLSPDGRLDTDGAGWVLTWAGQLPLLLDTTKTIEHKAVFGPGQMVLVKLDDPPSVLMERQGVPRNGLMGTDARAVLHVTDAGRRRGGCLQITLQAPEQLEGRTLVRLSGVRELVALHKAQVKTVTVPLRDDVRVHARGKGRVVALDQPTSVLLGPFARLSGGC